MIDNQKCSDAWSDPKKLDGLIKVLLVKSSVLHRTLSF